MLWSLKKKNLYVNIDALVFFKIELIKKTTYNKIWSAIFLKIRLIKKTGYKWISTVPNLEDWGFKFFKSFYVYFTLKKLQNFIVEMDIFGNIYSILENFEKLSKIFTNSPSIKLSQISLENVIKSEKIHKRMHFYFMKKCLWNWFCDSILERLPNSSVFLASYDEPSKHLVFLFFKNCCWWWTTETPFLKTKELSPIYYYILLKSKKMSSSIHFLYKNWVQHATFFNIFNTF